MLRSSPGLVRLIVIVTLVTSACAPRPGGAPGDPNLLFKDDFAKTDSGWDKYTGAEGTVDYADGQYLIKVDKPNIYLWGTPGLNLTDSILEVDTTYAAGSVNNEFGVICRLTESGDQKSFLGAPGAQSSAAVRQDPAAANHLSATCAGSQMSFSVNGVELSKFEDNDLKHGDVGLVVGTYDEGGAGIRFDNVTVRKP